MVTDVVFTIAVIAGTAGAITELQIRMGHIRTSANGTAMGVGGVCIACSGILFIGGGEMDHLVLGGLGLVLSA